MSAIPDIKFTLASCCLLYLLLLIALSSQDIWIEIFSAKCVLCVCVCVCVLVLFFPGWKFCSLLLSSVLSWLIILTPFP